MSKVAIPAGSFRAIVHVGDDGDPIGEEIFPFVPLPGIRIVDPRTNCYSEIRSVCWDGDEARFLVEIDDGPDSISHLRC